ncbi:hypothetical protein N568_0112065 [Lactococcus garvieae TRF1]|uniref:Uncharacterized protein n=1 Tax=Lactococcus garvieae TRF1 TaxID=1380772 RepID=V8AL69_9LACT|nr:hypothetical protein N568_0112065 [Lactococcus garvieae TRF1]
MKKLYAVYRGESFLDCGTASELAARFDTGGAFFVQKIKHFM